MTHGLRATYQQHACRCPLCRRAEALYHVAYAKGQIPGWQPAQRAKEHLDRLRLVRIGLDRAAALTGLSRQTVLAIRTGARRQIHPRTETAILALQQPSLAWGQIITGYETRERLRRLIEEGYTVAYLAERLGTYTANLYQVSPSNEGKGVTVRTWRKVKALEAQLDPPAFRHAS